MTMYFDKDNLECALEAIGKIQEYTRGMDEAAFLSHKMTQDAVIRNFEVLGNTIKKLSPELRARYSDIPWQQIIDFRNKLTHEYKQIDLVQVWTIIDLHLEPLRLRATDIIERKMYRVEERVPSGPYKLQRLLQAIDRAQST